MGYSKSMLSTLALILLLISAPQPSHTLTLEGIEIAHVVILGTIFCSVTGNPERACGQESCPRLSGAVATVSCNGGTTTLAQAVTDTTGTIRVVLSTIGSMLFDASACRVIVFTPVASCSVFPPTGTLSSGLTLLNVVRTLTGGVATFTTGLFQAVSGN